MTVGSEQDDPGAQQADRHTGHVPAIRGLALYAPQPDHRCGDVNTAVIGIGAASEVEVKAGEQESEQRQASAPRDESERGAV